MSSFARLLTDREERSSDVRLLHKALETAAQRPSPETYAPLFAILREAHLWTLIAGPLPPKERLDAQARLSGHVTLAFRSRRTEDGADCVVAATTAHRLASARIGQSGDTAIRVPFQFLVFGALDGGADAIYLNPGSTPSGFLPRDLLIGFANNALPDANDPERRVQLMSDDLGPIEVADTGSLPDGLLPALRAAIAREPEIADASLVVHSIGSARIYQIVAVIGKPAALEDIKERLAQQVVGLIGELNYFGVEPVVSKDPRLDDPIHSIRLLPA